MDEGHSSGSQVSQSSSISSLYFLSPRPPSTSKVQVLYGGTDLFDYEVRRTFNNDMLLAFISSSCIAALVYILTSCSGTASRKAHVSQRLLSLQHAPACSSVQDSLKSGLSVLGRMMPRHHDNLVQGHLEYS